jgi:hypothetical protein
MKRLLITLIIFNLSIGAKAQVYNGNLTLTTQAQVDAFNYVKVTGQLAIGGTGITNLNGLSELKECGLLEIQHATNLTSIIGLANLEQVYHLIIIDGNSSLTTLTGFSSLWKIGDQLDLSNHNIASGLRIMNNAVLEDVGFFSSLLFVSRLNIHDNPLLKNIDGFYQYDQPQNQIFGYIEINANESLENIDGLASFSKNVYGFISIFANNSLTNIDGLANVTSAGERIFINNNPSLVSVGMTHLKEVPGLDLGNNASLINLDGLSSLEKVGDLLIYNDPSLTSINGLTALKEVSSITIKNCSLLGDVSAFSKITDVWQSIKLDGNASLANLDGFSNLESIGGGLQITSNALLSSLDGLAKLTSIGAEFHPDTALKISGNTSLSDFCDLSKVFGSVGEIDGTVSITGNGANTVTIIPPADITLPNDAGLCSKDISSVAPANATVSGCLGPQPPSHSDYPPGNIFPVGTTIITWSVTDATGNTATAEQKVVITDNENPVITAFPTDITVTCDKDVPAADIASVSASDNCSGSVVVTHVGDVVSDQTCANRYTITRTYKATDASNNSIARSQMITVNDNIPPQVTGLSTSKQVLAPANHKMQDITVNYSVTDNCNSSPTYSISVASNEAANGTADGNTEPDFQIIDDHHIRLRAERAATGSGRIYTITITADDGCNPAVSSSTTVVVAHNITAPQAGHAFKVGSTVDLSGEFWDVPANKHTAKWLIDGSTTVSGGVIEPSGSKNGKVSGNYKFTSPGIYKIQMNVTDQNKTMNYANTNGELEALVVIYDPANGNAYGGGYFNSPAGGLASNRAATGKVSYGFTVSNFKNSTYPKGETQLNFSISDFEFNALNFEYLMISGANAQFKGTGKVAGDRAGYAFIMTVTDGQLDGTGVDKVRIKIYNNRSGVVIYDNQPGAGDAALPTQAVGSNSTVVIGGASQAKRLSGSVSVKSNVPAAELVKPSEEFNVNTYPNPTSANFSLIVHGTTNEKVSMQVFDIFGRLVEIRNVAPNAVVKFGDLYRTGTYFVRIKSGKSYKELKVIKLSE